MAGMIALRKKIHRIYSCLAKSFLLCLLVVSFMVALSISMSIHSPTDERSLDYSRGNSYTGDKLIQPKGKKAQPRMAFSKDIPMGILSQKPKSFFRRIQNTIDHRDPVARCRRYGFQYNPHQPKRRIFYGSLIAEEPWELLEIVATEVYGIYHKMVFVESNRTQNFDPRPVRRASDPQQQQQLQELFGTNQLEIKLYVNEKSQFTGIRREHAQRQEILHGWKELGMTSDDIGLIADADETFSRDYLRAAQECDIPSLNYTYHKCYTSNVKIAASSRVFETSPECVTERRGWYHPEMVLGACIEQIGNRSVHPLAFRDGPRRAHGWGRACTHDFSNIKGNHPLWSASDFRMLCGQQTLLQDPTASNYTGFHFHNFFTNFNTTRIKYSTYGHPVRKAFSAPLEDIAKNDLRLMYRCIKDIPDVTDAKWKRVIGGINASLPPIPIYFQDHEYRRKRHELVTEQVRADDEMVAFMQAKLREEYKQ